MKDWSEYEGRSALNKEAGDHGLWPVMHVDWTNLSEGSTMNVQTTVEDKTSDSQTNSWEFEVEASAGKRIPKVCTIEAKLSTGYSGSLMNETTTTSEYGHRISASLKKLHFTSQGINLTGLHANAFLFNPQVNPNWTYLDSLNGMKPFYLAWIVTSASESLLLQSPPEGELVDNEGILFTWRPEDGNLHDYELVIATSSNISDVNTVYRKKTNDLTQLAVNNFIAQPGVTYYWGVKGINVDGVMIYSPIRSFRMNKSLQENPYQEIRTVICSSPGTLSDLRIVVSPLKDGPVAVTLTDLSGKAMARKEATGYSGVALAFSFSGENLAPGIYLAVIRSGEDRVVRKVIIR
jgi:hypothetical protein